MNNNVLSLVALSMASSGRDFDPRTRAFSDEELKPQPMIKKSRKQVRQSDNNVYSIYFGCSKHREDECATRCSGRVLLF